MIVAESDDTRAFMYLAFGLGWWSFAKWLDDNNVRDEWIAEIKGDPPTDARAKWIAEVKGTL